MSDSLFPSTPRRSQPLLARQCLARAPEPLFRCRFGASPAAAPEQAPLAPPGMGASFPPLFYRLSPASAGPIVPANRADSRFLAGVVAPGQLPINRR